MCLCVFVCVYCGQYVTVCLTFLVQYSQFHCYYYFYVFLVAQCMHISLYYILLYSGQSIIYIYISVFFWGCELHHIRFKEFSYKNKDIMENVAQTGEYGEWHSRLKISIPVLFVCLFFQMILVHIWAGLGLGWFLSTDQSREVWTWIKTLFVPDFNT